jgi:hypothetical protein
VLKPDLTGLDQELCKKPENFGQMRGTRCARLSPQCSIVLPAKRLWIPKTLSGLKMVVAPGNAPEINALEADRGD